MFSSSKPAASAARNAQGVAEVVQVKQEYAGAIAKACYGYALSKPDSRLERESKTAIDEVFGGEVNYQGVCNALVFWSSTVNKGPKKNYVRSYKGCSVFCSFHLRNWWGYQLATGDPAP